MIYLWRCNDCDVYEEVQRPIAECAMPPEGGDCEAVAPGALTSGHNWVRVFQAPMQLKASFPDGHKRKGWDVLKESARLEKEAAVSKKETKAEIRNEIRKMGIKPGSD